MKQMLELLLIGASALLFSASVFSWLQSDRQFHESLQLAGRHMNEERVVIIKGGS